MSIRNWLAEIMARLGNPGGKTEPVPAPEPVHLPPFEQMEPGQKLRQLERWGEEAYDRMYETRYPSGDYSEAKENFHMAIQLARELGREEEVKRLEARLQHIKDVFRSQFA